MQGVLGKNSVISLDWHDDTIDIYFGFQKFSTIPRNKKSLAFKATIAMLVNAGISISQIKKNFKVSFKTAKKYSKVFNEATSEKDLADKLRNSGRTIYKVTEEVSDFIQARADFYKSKGREYFNKLIVKDVYEKFSITLADDYIRVHLKKRNGWFNFFKTDTKTKTDNKENNKEQTTPADAFNQKLKKENISNPQNKTFRNKYAGLFLLSSYCTTLFQGFPKTKTENKKYSIKSLLVWWLYFTLLGAKNFERQRYINVNDFEYISGYSRLPSVETMRKYLTELSLNIDTEISTKLLKKNIDCFITEDTDYYIDGHISEYTGKAKILSTWSTLKNRVCKGSIDYFVHDSAGNPIFSLIMDGFSDFREVIIHTLSKIKKLRPGKMLTLIYDRGGFSIDLMKHISEKKNQFFIACPKQKT